MFDNENVCRKRDSPVERIRHREHAGEFDKFLIDSPAHRTDIDGDCTFDVCDLIFNRLVHARGLAASLLCSGARI
jgi:hypothetical protein